MSTPLIIALDGSSGAGKSSAARELSGRLSCLYIDTGAHYRTVTYLLQEKKISYTTPDLVAAALQYWDLDEDIEDNIGFIRINHRRIEDPFLRTALINAEVSFYSAIPAVRQFLFGYQRSQAAVAERNSFKGLVMEGRDIGLNIFPNTPFKYFLHADPLVKMRRRAADGISDVTDLRDTIDSTQGQFKKSPTAIDVDTTQMTLLQVVDFIQADINAKIKNPS